MLCHIGWCKFTDVSEVFAASNTLMMKAASTSDMLVNFNQTTYHNPKD
jgi:hypothetical protein